MTSESVGREYLDGGLAHVHTEASKDGFFSVDELGEYIRNNLKSEYFMINDHLTDPRLINPIDMATLDEKIKEQKRIVGAFNERDGLPKCILGVEANITPDGVDIPQQLLTQFDFVIASKHHPFGDESPDSWANSMIKAMENEEIDAIGHADRYLKDEVDWDRILRVAEKTRTAIEINTDTFPSFELLKKFSNYNLLYIIGLDFHSFHGVKYRPPLFSEVTADLSEVRKIMKDGITDRIILKKEYLSEAPGYTLLATIVRNLLDIQRAGINPGSILNLDGYDSFMKRIGRPKNER